MTLVRNRKFAVAQCVPQLDRTVPRARDDLAIVGGEGDGEDIVGVADEAAGRHAGSEFPQPKSLVPGGREGIGTIGRDNLEKGKKKKQVERQQREKHNTPRYRGREWTKEKW